MGTPDIAVPCLEMLCKRDDCEIVGVVTQPDRKKGRGYELAPPPVKEFALSRGLEVFQPEILKDGAFSEVLEEKKPDIIIVIAYGRILPPYIIDYPKYGCINVHASLLPKYRGAAPLQWCIINGEDKTGVTIMQMDNGLDTGDMLLVEEIAIEDNETTGTLFDKASLCGAETLSKALDLIFEGKVTRTPQNHEEMTYAPMITKEMSYIDWSKSAESIRNLIRGLNPSPGAKTVAGGKIIKIFEAEVDGETNEAPGVVCCVDKCFKVACGDGKMLSLKSLQPEGKKRLEINEYIKGNNIPEGFVLGN
ncbi:MAG: methionyl-tRNA formyltransferase [Clostridia bacterium]|nr:methionyl-tRNA formyltransferase [Clostridia bacterium]